MRASGELREGEVICPECDGDGEVTASGVHPSRYPGGTSAMSAPDEWKELCPRCAGVGFLDKEAEDEPNS